MEYDNMLKNFTTQEVRALNPLVLAYVGDAIYELLVRTYLIDKFREKSAHKLHVDAISFVKAHAQSEFSNMLQDKLTEEETEIFKRGRNAKSQTVPKNAQVQEYRKATGFEALMGYLYLTNNQERIYEIFNDIIDCYNRNKAYSEEK